MATRRMLSRSIGTSQKVSKLSIFAALVYTWIIPHCDDYGQMAGNADSVKWEVIPRIDKPEKDVESALKEMEAVGLIKRFIVKGKQFLKVENFDSFQTFKSDRNRKSIINGIQWNPMESNGTLGKVRLGKVRLNNNILPLRGKKMYKLQPDNTDKVIDLDTLEEKSSLKEERIAQKGYDPKNTNILLAWGQEKLGRKFTKPLKQKRFIADMLAAGNSVEKIKERWEELEDDEFWGKKGIDFSIVASQIDKARPEKKINSLLYAKHR